MTGGKFAKFGEKLKAQNSAEPELRESSTPEQPNTVTREEQNSGVQVNRGNGIPEGKEKFSTVLTNSTAERVRVYAARKRLRPWQVVEMALVAWLDRNGG